MWYPATVTVPAEAGPVTLDEAKARLNIYHDDQNADTQLIIDATLNHVEKYCGTRFAEQTIVAKCDAFADFCRLPEAPVQSVTSITYVDTDGAPQTLADTVYELRNDGLDVAIVKKYGQSWPAIQKGSRITLEAVVGYEDAPPAVKHAMLLFIGSGYQYRENEKDEGWTVLDSLLCNFRRGV